MGEQLFTWPIATTHATPHGTCHKCHLALYIGLVHHCPTALPFRDLSPFGGGRKP